MRILSSEECVYVTGGNKNPPSEEEDEEEDPEERWWHDAFDALSDGLSALGSFTGLFGQYLNMFAEMVDTMGAVGDDIYDRQNYREYCIEQQIEGGACESYEDWLQN